MKILHLDSSVTGAQSVSRPLSKATTEQLVKSNPGAEVVYRDLVGEPLSHYTAVLRVHGADFVPVTDAEKLELTTGEEILAEFLASDLIVIGAPMYNFGIPSQLKAWVDLICVAGKTFSYTSEGPKGLCGAKKVILVSTRGGQYGEGSPYAPMDFQEKYLKGVLGFLGITDVTVVRAEGLARGGDVAKLAVESAYAEIAKL
ncbi:FMN-dependent NADH-azoreductase [Granulicella pectinivorans]|jgi:FMN-dependent NADH-azoreductase|uniref:FMN dependent NADH:quinone oxidoreductase n=1 Tax=Granulicella pectinivorans TaxID=474950 RepID=A0A1I6MAG0_9BACT|nr:NAD(P)H-dependent oxidoreductase [Granulicella pectinivorans]SFS12627.1 FMN-dependent NADH-azoreductase [Granulicella pectinivorans]